MAEMSAADREIYQEDLKKAKAEVDDATNVKELIHAVSREIALRQCLTAEVAPQLLYSDVSIGCSHLFERLARLGWQHAVPVEQLGLRLVDCTALADLLHVIHLPLCNDTLPMAEADRAIACQAVRRLQAALSSLDSAKLEILGIEMRKLQEARDDKQATQNGQYYFVIYNDRALHELTLALAWGYESDRYSLASHQRFRLKSGREPSRMLVISLRVMAKRLSTPTATTSTSTDRTYPRNVEKHTLNTPCSAGFRVLSFNNGFSNQLPVVQRRMIK